MFRKDFPIMSSTERVFNGSVIYKFRKDGSTVKRDLVDKPCRMAPVKYGEFLKKGKCDVIFKKIF